MGWGCRRRQQKSIEPGALETEPGCSPAPLTQGGTPQGLPNQSDGELGSPQRPYLTRAVDREVSFHPGVRLLESNLALAQEAWLRFFCTSLNLISKMQMMLSILKGCGFLFVCFLWLYPWHMEVPRPGTKYELHLQPTYAAAMAVPDLLTYCTGLGIEPVPPQ